MAQQSERKFGTLPEWAKSGPIDLRNYDHRAEKHCADNNTKRSGEHPTVSLSTKEFPLWQEYFERWLRGRPFAFQLLIDATISEMTVPEPAPQWFDPSFIPTIGWRSSYEIRPSREFVVGHRANVFVPAEHPNYQAMVDRTATAHAREFCGDHDRPGIWVPRGWIEDRRARPQTPRRFTADDMRKLAPPQEPMTEAAE